MVEDDTTVTGEAWRDEWCPHCRGNRQHHRCGENDREWCCAICGHVADAHTARRLTGAESNQRKLPGRTQ